MKRETIARRIVTEILNVGLGNSTFQEKFPMAYLELLKNREDIELSVLKKLPKSTAEKEQ